MTNSDATVDQPGPVPDRAEGDPPETGVTEPQDAFSAETAAETGLPVRPQNQVETGAERRGRRPVLGVPIEVIISVGRARPLLSDLIALGRDSVLSLDSKLEDPVEIMIGGRVIARGELQELEAGGQLGVRLTDVEDLSGAA